MPARRPSAARRYARAAGTIAAAGLLAAAIALLIPVTGAPRHAAPAGALRIHDVQGNSWVSPYDGRKVTDVPGVVTAVRRSGSSPGYWVQDPHPDGNPATSEAVFVFSRNPAVTPGDSVRVSGTVKDYYPTASGQRVATTSNLSVTEITSATATVVSSGNPLPAAQLIDGRSVPDAYAPRAHGTIEATGIAPSRSALDFWEAREGMLVEIRDGRVIGPTDSYGEFFLTDKADQHRTDVGGAELLSYAGTPSGRIGVAPVDGKSPALDVGDVLAGATTGPVDYSQYGGYLIAATGLPAVRDGGAAPTIAAPQQPDQLSIATYNVENLAPSDPATKIARLAAGVVHNLASPDIVAVEEVQDDDGRTDDGVVSAGQTLQTLTAAIRAAGGPGYRWRQIDPGNDADGGQPGGNIRVVFLFNPARVSFDDRGTPSAAAATAVTDSGGVPSLTESPGRIDPGNAAWTASRKPLAGEFSFRGSRVFVIANHFVAKLGDDNTDGRFQPPARPSDRQRERQAGAVHGFVSSLLAVDRAARIVVVGDMNDFPFSPSMAVLRTGGLSGSRAVLTDLISTLPVGQRYTYVYQGISQVLDHILVSGGAGTGQYQVVHINADFADQASDHDPQLVRLAVR